MADYLFDFRDRRCQGQIKASFFKGSIDRYRVPGGELLGAVGGIKSQG